MSARTEFTIADIAEFWAATHDLQRRVATLERLVETLVTAKLDQTEVNGDVRRRLVKLEYMPRPQLQGYSRSGPASDWQDGTLPHPKGEDDG